MRLEYYPHEKLKKEILHALGRHLDLAKYQVFFFGSRVTGKGTDRSDIDVGIAGQEPIPAGVWLEIQEEIEDIPTLYKIDIVDFAHVPKKFRDVALEKVEQITLP